MQVSLWTLRFCYTLLSKYLLFSFARTIWLDASKGYTSTYWFGQYGFWIIQNSGNQVCDFFSLVEFSLSVSKFYHLGPVLSKLPCVTNLHDNWNWAGRKDTEIHGAAIGITTAVDITLCWRQVTDTQSSNCRNRRGGDAEHHNQQVMTAPCHWNVPKIHFVKKAHFIFPIALWGKFVRWALVWALFDLRFPPSG